MMMMTWTTCLIYDHRAMNDLHAAFAGVSGAVLLSVRDRRNNERGIRPKQSPIKIHNSECLEFRYFNLW